MSIKSINLAKLQAFSQPFLFASQAGAGESGTDLADDTGLPAITGTGAIARRLVGWNSLQFKIGIAKEPTFIIGFSADAYSAEIANAIQIRAVGTYGIPSTLPELLSPKTFDYNAKGAIVRPGDTIYLDFTRCAKALWAAWDIASYYEASSPSAGAGLKIKGSIEDARQLVDVLLTYQGDIHQATYIDSLYSWQEDAYKPISPSKQFYNNLGHAYAMVQQEGREYTINTSLLKAEQPSFNGLKTSLVAYYNAQSLDTSTAGALWTDSATGSVAMGQKNQSLAPSGKTPVQVQGTVQPGALGFGVFAPPDWLESDSFKMRLPASAQGLDGIRFFVQRFNTFGTTNAEFGGAFYNLQISQNAKGELYLHADDEYWSVASTPALQPLFYSDLPIELLPTGTGEGTDTQPYLLTLGREALLTRAGLSNAVHCLYSGLTSGQTLGFCIKLLKETDEPVAISLLDSFESFSNSERPALKAFWALNGAPTSSVDVLPLNTTFGSLTVPAGANGLLVILAGASSAPLNMLDVADAAQLSYTLGFRLLEV